MGKRSFLVVLREYFSIMITTRKISTTGTINRLILFFQRIPLIGKHIPDSLYGKQNAKLILTVLATFHRLFKRLVIKGMYIGYLVFFAYMVFNASDRSVSEFPIEAVMSMFFFMSFIGASLGLNKAMNLDVGTDLLIIDKLRADAERYVPARIFERKIIDIGASLPFALVLSVHRDYTILQALAIPLLVVCAKLIGELLYLTAFAIFRRFLRNIYKPLSYVFLSLAILSLIAPFPLVASGTYFPFRAIVFHPAFIAPLITMALISVAVIVKFPHYRQLAWGTVVTYTLAVEKIKPRQRQQQFGNVSKWNTGLKSEDLSSVPFAHLTGYAFFNKLFFHRHKNFFGKKILIRVCIVAGILIGMLILLLLTDLDLNEMTESKQTTLLPMCFFLSYMISLGRPATGAMFANCDVAMLNYPFYRTPSVVIRNFYLRLKTILLYNAPAFALISLLPILSDILRPLFNGSSADEIAWIMIVPYFVTVAMMWVFFSFHDLFIYYIIQPYTSDLGTKSKLFSVIQMVVYMLSYMNMQLRDLNVVIYMSVIIVSTLLYFVIGLLCINKFCPKTFRLK